MLALVALAVGVPVAAVLACVAIRCANRTIVMTIAAATRITTTPSAIPTYQPVISLLLLL